jgi:hypothetical protein
VSPWESTWKKSQASMVDAGVCRNCRHVVSVSRTESYPPPLQDAADGGRSHAVAKLDQLALDSLVSPAGILPGYALDQLGHGGGDGRASDAMWICPFPGNQATMPAQDCARCDHAMPPQHLRQPADERGEDRSIRPVHPRPWIRSPHDGNFVAQYQELDVLRRRRTAEQQQQVQQPHKDQVKQTQRHEPRSCPDG